MDAPVVADRTSPLFAAGTWGRPNGPFEVLTDAELAELALSSDPDEPLAGDAVALEYLGLPVDSMLPSWYMPPALVRGIGGWRSRVIVALVLAFLLIEVAGLCFTYGPILP